ncbi:MAG: hypothetical protein SXV54_10780, partial [Chloroflexota bacterium]|nr:hypothetical protein [Chloroflexota bacterium]
MGKATFKHKHHAHFLRWERLLAFPFVYIACIAVLLSFFIPAPAAAQPTGYQEYYVLGYEEHVWRAFLAIYDGDDDHIPSQICSTVSLVATADYQVVYYDHWEDGYETDLLNPVQPSTKIYGDGDLGNGGEGNDILLAGIDVSLTSNQNNGTINGYVPVNPRDSDQIRYDGGDRIITSGGPVDLTHAMWPIDNSWVGGAWEVYSRQAYANAYSYHLPIGEDLYTFDADTYGDFRNVYLQLGAFEDNTTISIDNGAGAVVNLTLGQGQTYLSIGYVNSTPVPPITINSGTTIRSNKPVQVGLVTGAKSPGSFSSRSFQGRLLIVLPDQQWGADYVVPIPNGFSADVGRNIPAEVYIFNPNDFPITVKAYDRQVQTSFVISPTAYISSTVAYSETIRGTLPQDSAARFTSSDGVFGVVVCADTSRTTYDWGFAGIPTKYLTQDYYVSWAPGSYNTPPTENGSPVWVTPSSDDVTFYVDFNEEGSGLDGVVDDVFTLDMLEQQRIFDPDDDNTGMHVWATGRFAVTWGEDPITAENGNPYLDMGVAILPLQQGWLDPVMTLDKTAWPTILPPAGGRVTFTLVTQAHNASPDDVSITDTLPANWAYVPNSTQVTYPNGGAGNPEPTISDQTLFWDLSTDLDLNQSLTLTFQAEITNTAGVTVSINQGEAVGQHAYSGALFNPTDEAVVTISPLNLIKSVSDVEAGIGDTLVYTLSYANLSDSVTFTDVMLHDAIPIQYVTFDAASDGGAYSGDSGTITWALGELAPETSGAVTFTVTVNNFVGNGTVIENAGDVSSNQTAKASSNIVRTTVLAPDIKFTKSGPTVAGCGQTITYTLSHENIGRAQATEVRIQDTIPLSTTYVTGSLAINTGSGWVALSDDAGDDMGAFSSLSSTLVITPGAIAAGDAGQIRFSVRIDESLPHGSLIRNWATLDRDLDIPRESNLAVTRISDLLIAKTSDQAEVAPSGLISYTLTYENVSVTTAQTNVYVREPIPDYTRFITASGVVSYSWNHGATWNATLPITPVTHIRWYDAQLPPGVQRTISFVVQVSDTLPTNTTIQNTAYTSSTQTGEHFYQWIPSNQVEVATVDLWVAKSANQHTAQAGDPISYTISYGNRGSAGAWDVQILDTIPASAEYITGSVWGTGVYTGGMPSLLWNVGTVA